MDQDPDSGDPKTYGSDGSGLGSATLGLSYKLSKKSPCHCNSSLKLSKKEKRNSAKDCPNVSFIFLPNIEIKPNISLFSTNNISSAALKKYTFLIFYLSRVSTVISILSFPRPTSKVAEGDASVGTIPYGR
jgi:hypothetical protein